MSGFAGVATAREEREKDHFLRKATELPVPGKRKRGRDCNERRRCGAEGGRRERNGTSDDDL